MPVFLYRAVDLERRQAVEGSIEAADDREARATLRARGVMPLAVEGTQAPAEGAESTLQRLLAALTWRPVPPMDLAVFVRQLAAMLEAGMPIVEALSLMEEQTTSPTLRDAIAEMHHTLLGGHMLSEALARHPRVFPPLMIHLTHVGELSGELAVMYGRLGEMIEKDVELTRKVRGALAYPSLVLAVLSVVVLVLVGFVVPTFAGLFAKTNAALPWPTLALITLSGFIRAWGLWLFGLGLAGVATYRWYRRTPAGKLVVDTLWLGVPLVGPLLRDQGANTFARAFGTVYGAGVPVVPALAACKDVITNAAIAGVIARAEAAVSAGETLAEQLRDTPFFPKVLAHMIAIGEQSGRLEELTARAVSFSDREIEHKISQLTTLLEPLLTLAIGLVVAFVALALYLPLFDLPKVLSGH